MHRQRSARYRQHAPPLGVRIIRASLSCVLNCSSPIDCIKAWQLRLSCCLASVVIGEALLPGDDSNAFMQDLQTSLEGLLAQCITKRDARWEDE